MNKENPFQLDYEDLFDSPQDLIKPIRRNPQIPYPLHTHEFAELVIVTRGQGYHYFEEEEYPVITGDVFVLQGKRAHGYKHLEGLCLINILFNPHLMEGALQDLIMLPGYHALFHLEPTYRKQHNFSSRLRLNLNQLSHTLALTEKIEKEYKSKKEGYRFLSTAYFMELIGYLCRIYSGIQTGETRELMAVGRVLAYLEENENKRITLNELCDLAGMTTSTLTRHFNRALGSSPVEYHLKLRIKRSCNLLRTSDLPITEIAYQCGFDDSNYYSRQFRRIMSCSPRQYRKGI